MANIEKAKLEKAEMEAVGKKLMEEKEVPPEKPKVKRTRKPKTTPVPIEVKVEPDPSEAMTEPETDIDEAAVLDDTPSKQSANPVSDVTSNAFYEFDQDAFANKIVNMLVQKGLAAPTPPVHEASVKPKKLKPRKPVVKKTTTSAPPPSEPSNPFMWM